MPPRVIPVDKKIGSARLETVTPTELQPYEDTTVTMTLGGLIGNVNGEPYLEDALRITCGYIGANGDDPIGWMIFHAIRTNHHLGVYQMIVRPTLPAGPYMVGVILKVEQDPSSRKKVAGCCSALLSGVSARRLNSRRVVENQNSTACWSSELATENGQNT